MSRLKNIIFLVLCGVVACKKNSSGPAPLISSFSPAKGAAFNNVTISGEHFGYEPSSVNVKFNGSVAFIDSLHDTVIYARTPMGVTTGKITVTVQGQTGTSASDFIVLSGNWTKKSDVPGDPRNTGIAFAINGKGYFATGHNGGSPTPDIAEYDPATDLWTVKTPSPIGLESSFCMVIGNKAYIGSGKSFDSGYTSRMWAYDPALDQWTQKADFPAVPTWGAFGIGIGNVGYAGFGNSKHWWKYDPASDSWSQKADLPGSNILAWSTGFAFNGKIYAGISFETSEWWQYDTASDLWTRKNDFPGNSGFSGSFVINGIPYIAGGGTECWKYDPATDQWTQLAFYGLRTAGAAFAIGNNGYYMTGSTNGGWLTKDCWQFSPP